MAATEEYVTSKQIQTRLKRSAGQLDGVLRMMDEGRPCDDVLVQLSAVKSSIDKAMKLVIARNINNCVDNMTGADVQNLEHSLDLLLKTK
ncbi:metal-sensitive transcriptional regulator [Lactiplantibacillus pentosus]|jgi:DNA-binding FrmR family transcriptional regulator|uniref:metal-sensitive transcriptional regulator n=1 Tax=Lactiplantibacillus pentosus TaxID=1589 RepID=UPI00259BA288|nr:metal-sensitive transcriptional regulator [Lactiplantibacillus pentosus]WFC03036.1 metal-sensitive transcriptional regulator [Lactiplantibacillus pentosus]